MPNIIELTVENFQSVLIEQSPEQLIVVELYSPRDEAGKGMSHDLVTLANELGESIILTRVNCEEQPQITQQFGVTSVPTVVLIRAGKPLDGLTGVTPIAQIKELLFKFLPKPEDDLLLKASALLMDETADINDAFTLIKQAYELAPDRIDIKLCYSEILIKAGQLKNAKTLLESFSLEDKNATFFIPSSLVCLKLL